MKKKILIGSIIAVAILVGVSLTSVVGYQSFESDVKYSPLFAVRTKRAVNKGQDSLAYQYIGKENTFPIPARASEVELVEKIINRIKMMDDKSFDMFVDRIISHIHQNNEIANIVLNDKEINYMLYQLRDNSEIIKNNFIMMIKDKEPLGPTIDMGWECKLAFLILLLMLPFFIIITIIRTIFEVILFIFDIICEASLTHPTIN